MLFGCNMLAGALLWLNLLIWPPIAVAQQYELELSQRLSDGLGGTTGDGKCHLSLQRIESVLLNSVYQKLRNGLTVRDMLGAKLEPLWTCDFETISKLHDEQTKLYKVSSSAGQCLREYLEFNLSQFVEYCVRIYKQDFVNGIRERLAIEDVDKLLPAQRASDNDKTRQDPYFIDPRVRVALGDPETGTCQHGINKVDSILEHVDDKDGTWLAGFNVKFILTVKWQCVWNCDMEVLRKHYEAEQRYKEIATSASRCMRLFHSFYYEQLISYCQRLFHDDGLKERVAQPYNEIVQKQAIVLNEAVQSALAKFGDSKEVVERFIAGEGGEELDFIRGRREEIVLKLLERYMEAELCSIACSSKKLKQLKSLRGACNDVVKALDSAKFLDSFKAPMQSLEVWFKAHHMCKYLNQIYLDSQSSIWKKCLPCAKLSVQ